MHYTQLADEKNQLWVLLVITAREFFGTSLRFDVLFFEPKPCALGRMVLVQIW